MMTKILRSSRWRLVWFLTLISVVRSMDGVNFSVAAKQIMPEYGLSNVRIGFLYTMYTLAYTLFHLPGGWLADVVGSRRLLSAALFWWSAFTMLTAVAPQLPALSLLGPFAAFMVVRFLIGLAEGACYPGSTRLIASWVAADERATAAGLVISGLGIGYGITPPIVAYLMVHYGWRVSFYAFGAVGVVTALCWYWYAADSPEESRRVSPQELEFIRRGQTAISGTSKHPIPWAALFGCRSVWMLGGAGFCLGYGIFIYQAWFYLYLVNVRGFSEIGGGFFATLPFLATTVLSPTGGALSDAMVRRFTPTTGRRIGAVLGFTASALCIALGAKVEQPYVAVVFLGLGDGFLYFAGASATGAIIDIAGQHAGVAYGFVQTMTLAGGVVAPTLTPVLANRFGWGVPIYLTASLAALGALLWFKVDAADRLSPGEELAVNARVAVAEK